MLELMYDLPSEEDVKEVVITEEMIVDEAKPILVYKTPEEIAAEKEAESKEEPDLSTGSKS